MAQNDDETTRGTGSSSVRVVILLFLGTLVLLIVLAVTWMFVRVDPSPASEIEPDSARSALGASPLWVLPAGKHGGFGQRRIAVLDDD